MTQPVLYIAADSLDKQQGFPNWRKCTIEAQPDVEIDWEVRQGQGDLVSPLLALCSSVFVNLQLLSSRRPLPFLQLVMWYKMFLFLI